MQNPKQNKRKSIARFNRQYLIDAYNATSTDDGHGEIEEYEHWLERQLISRLQKIELLEAHGGLTLDQIYDEKQGHEANIVLNASGLRTKDVETAARKHASEILGIPPNEILPDDTIVNGFLAGVWWNEFYPCDDCDQPRCL